MSPKEIAVAVSAISPRKCYTLHWTGHPSSAIPIQSTALKFKVAVKNVD